MTLMHRSLLILFMDDGVSSDRAEQLATRWEADAMSYVTAQQTAYLADESFAVGQRESQKTTSAFNQALLDLRGYASAQDWKSAID
jgi:hypothetical protein